MEQSEQRDNQVNLFLCLSLGLLLAGIAAASAYVVAELPLATLAACGVLFLFIAGYAKPIIFLSMTAYSLVLTQSFPILQAGGREINLSSDYILIPLLIMVSFI